MALIGEIAEARNLHAPPSLSHWILLFLLVSALFVLSNQMMNLSTAALVTGLGAITYVLDGHFFILIAILLAVAASLFRTANGKGIRTNGLNRELAIIGLGYGIYEIGRLLSRSNPEQAYANADRLIRFQDWLSLPREHELQAVVIQSHDLTLIFNLIYSHAFLATVIGVLFYLFFNDQLHYRLYRNTLGISAMLTVALSALVPVAPPRLAVLDVIDTQVALGGQHGFINEFAALPSLHVGWTALAGFMLARSLGGRRGISIGPVAPLIIGFTVIVTGNHYWIDGVVGIAICLVPVTFLISLANDSALGATTPRVNIGAIAEHSRRASRYAIQFLSSLGAGPLVLFAVLAYLIIGQVVAPGFTDHWGYLTAQVFATVLIMLVATKWSGRSDLFRPLTQLLIVLATVLDVFGTTEDLYATYAAYDKIVHLTGTAAFTSVVIDIGFEMRRRGKLKWPVDRIITVAVFAGICAGGLWEMYELAGDRVFDSARIGGIQDTTYDLIFDSIGAVVAGLLGRRVDVPELQRRSPITTANEPDPHFAQPFGNAGDQQ